MPGGDASGLGELGHAMRAAMMVIGGGEPRRFVTAEWPRPSHGARFGKVVPDGADWRRSQGPGDGAMRLAHELSCQKGEWRSTGRGGAPSEVIGPPQAGQRSKSLVVDWRGWSAGAGRGIGGGTANSLRQSASFSARWPLARKP